MASQSFFDLPEAAEFTGLSMDSDGVVEIQYKSPQKPETICRLKFPLAAAPNLAGWLVNLVQRAGPASDSTHSTKKH